MTIMAQRPVSCTVANAEPGFPADLFARLDEARIAAEFARLTGEDDILAAAECTSDMLIEDILDLGYILDTRQVTAGMPVQNMHGDTGSSLTITPALVTVRWDAPSNRATTFSSVALAEGALRHQS